MAPRRKADDDNVADRGNASPNAQALVASARRIDFTDAEEKKRYKKRQKNWQDEAWRYYDELPEIWFAGQFIGNCLRKVRLFAATQPDVSQPPVAIDEKASGLEAQARVEVERLGQAEGGIGGILGAIGLNLSVPGECVLLGQEDPETGLERWKVYSADELFVNNENNWAIRTVPTDRKGKPIAADASPYRIWRQHPHWSDWADSPLRPLLDVCEELLILSRAIRAAGRSRLAGAGLLLWPSEAIVNTSNASQVVEGAGGHQVDPVLADLMQAMLTPIADEGTAAAVVPLPIKMAAEYIEKVRHLLFDRPIDATMAGQRKELRERIASGVDLPAAILLGIEDVNHWTGWMIDEQAFKAHLEPLVITICHALTSNFLRPAIGAVDDVADSTPDVLVWYDAQALIAHPNKSQDTKDAHDRYLISDKAAANRIGINDDEMPTIQEIDARVARKAAEHNRNIIVPGELQAGPPATAPAAVPVARATTTSAFIASGRVPKRLGLRLAQRDRELRIRLDTAADAAVFRALQVAGASVRRRAGRDNAAATILADVPNELVIARLGLDVAAGFGFNVATALETSFDNLSMRFDREVGQAQQTLRRQMADYDDENVIDEEAFAARQSENRRDGLAFVVAALTAITSQRLVDPSPQAPPLGEHSTDLLVPPGVMRSALAIAGGHDQAAAGEFGELGGPTGGVFTGETALDVFRDLGIGPSGYEWMVGDPSRPFPPHEELEGVEFASFDDEALLADTGEFPYVDHYFPGDHEFCQCDFAPVLEVAA